MLPTSLSASASSSARSGDVDSTSGVTFNYNGAFNVGSGTQDATSKQDTGSGGLNSTTLLILAAVAALGLVAVVYARK